MRKSVKTIDDLWYSAWMDAGQPILDGMLASDNLFFEEVIIGKSISEEDARGH